MRAEAVRWPECVECRTILRLLDEVARLKAALTEVMVPIEVLSAPGDDAWELAPEVRGELLTARTLGRAALWPPPPV
jgi:hypothetical protein